MRWGIMGAAGIARKEFLPAMALAEGAEAVALACRDAARGRAMADEFGIATVHESYEALLADGGIEAVYIPLPNHLHVPMTVASLEAGKHVLCEKPFALRADDLAAVEAAAARSGKLAMEGFMVAHHPQWQQVRDWIADGAIGALRHVEGTFAYHNTDPANVRNMADIGGGGLYDIGVYPIVTARLVLGREPARVACMLQTDPAFGTDRVATGLLDFGDVTASFYVSTQAHPEQRMRFHGDQGWIDLPRPFNAWNTGEQVLTLHRGGHEPERAVYRDVNQYTLQIEQFGRAARGEEPPRFTLEASMANMRVIDALFRAARNGTVETV